MLYCGRNQTFWARLLAICAEGAVEFNFFDPQSNMKSRFCSFSLLWGILVLYFLSASVQSRVSAADASAGDPETYGPQNMEFHAPSPEEKMPRTAMDGISDSIILGEEEKNGTQSAPETPLDRESSTPPVVLETVAPQTAPSSETGSESTASNALPNMKSNAASEPDFETESESAAAPSCFSAILDRGNRKNAFHFASAETVTPLDTPSETASAQTAAPTETAAPSQNKPVSLSVSLLERLCPADQLILENVQAVDLQTFLGSPNLQYSEDGLASALRLYWKSSALKSETVFRLRQAEELGKLAGSAAPASQAVYRSAADAAKTKADAAKLTLRANALELGRTAGYTESMTAQTLPHAGAYETQFRQFVPAYGSRAAYLHGLLDFRRQQLISAASAYVSAENLLKMQTAEKADAEKILQSWETLEHRRKLFFDVLTEFNAEILQYVLLISRRRGPDLVPLLVRPQNASSAEKTFADENRLDAPAVPYVAAPGTSDVPVLSADEKNTAAAAPASMPLPTDTESSAGIPQNTVPNGPGLPTFAEDASKETPVYEENAAIDVVLPTADPMLQPYGAPAAETAPPGSDFQPIGGPNGVISDPTLGSPAMQDGAARFPQDPLRRQSFRPVSPSEAFIQLTAKPSVLVEPPKPVSETELAGTSGSSAAFQAGLSLRNVLERTDYSRREEAIRNYWHYVFLQKQICVLKYQETLLSAMTDRVFADSENAGAGKFGVALEFHSLVLRTELLGTEAEAWKILYRISQLIQIPLTWPTEFPEALTELKAENFQLSTSRLSPGSAEEARFLPIIHQLYTSAGHLPEAFRKVQAQESLIAPPLRNAAENSVTSRLKTADYAELKTLLGSMTSARKDSFEYLKFLFQTNALYSTCILAADPFGSAPEKLEQTLTN